ncbi:MAG: PEGA domain-containing protein [Myxococcales bacterium]|jgi:hypothetical protein
MLTLIRTLLASLLVASPALAIASSLKITTDPPDAVVQLDGVAYGPAPVTIPKVAPGTHELKVAAEGYVTRVDLLQVSEGEDLQVHAPLNPAPKVIEPPPRPAAAPTPPPAAPGYQAQVAPPPPAYGSPVPPPPPAAGYAQTAPSAYATAAPPPSAVPASPAPATAAPATSAQPQAATPPLPPAPLPVSQLPTRWGTQKKSCTLLVETTPPGAMVQVIGMPMAKPGPAVFTGFSPGTIKLQVNAPGYKDKMVAVDISGDARTRVVLDPLQ